MAHEPIEVWCIPLGEGGKEGEPRLEEVIIPDDAYVKKMLHKYGKMPKKIVIRQVEQ